MKREGEAWIPEGYDCGDLFCLIREGKVVNFAWEEDEPCVGHVREDIFIKKTSKPTLSKCGAPFGGSEPSFYQCDVLKSGLLGRIRPSLGSSGYYSPAVASPREWLACRVFAATRTLTNGLGSSIQPEA